MKDPYRHLCADILLSGLRHYQKLLEHLPQIERVVQLHLDGLDTQAIAKEMKTSPAQIDQIWRLGVELAEERTYLTSWTAAHLYLDLDPAQVARALDRLDDGAAREDKGAPEDGAAGVPGAALSERGGGMNAAHSNAVILNFADRPDGVGSTPVEAIGQHAANQRRTRSGKVGTA